MTNNAQYITDIYSVYVSALMATEGKRQNANQVYLSLSLVLITAFTTVDRFPTTLSAGILAFIALIWFITIMSYRSLAKAKFAVIAELEEQLAFKPFLREWQIVSGPHKILGLARLEMLAPCVLFSFSVYIYLGGN